MTCSFVVIGATCQGDLGAFGEGMLGEKVNFTDRPLCNNVTNIIFHAKRDAHLGVNLGRKQIMQLRPL